MLSSRRLQHVAEQATAEIEWTDANVLDPIWHAMMDQLDQTQPPTPRPPPSGSVLLGCNMMHYWHAAFAHARDPIHYRDAHELSGFSTERPLLVENAPAYGAITSLVQLQAERTAAASSSRCRPSNASRNDVVVAALARGTTEAQLPNRHLQLDTRPFTAAELKQLTTTSAYLSRSERTLLLTLAFVQAQRPLATPTLCLPFLWALTRMSSYNMAWKAGCTREEILWLSANVLGPSSPLGPDPTPSRWASRSRALLGRWDVTDLSSSSAASGFPPDQTLYLAAWVDMRGRMYAVRDALNVRKAFLAVPGTRLELLCWRTGTATHYQSAAFLGGEKNWTYASASKPKASPTPAYGRTKAWHGTDVAAEDLSRHLFPTQTAFPRPSLAASGHPRWRCSRQPPSVLTETGRELLLVANDFVFGHPSLIVQVVGAGPQTARRQSSADDRFVQDVVLVEILRRADLMDV